MAALFQHGLAERLTRKQVVPQINRVEDGGIAPAMSGQPALGRPVLAILLFSAVLGGDEFRRQRNDLVVPRRHHRRRQHGVVIFRLALASGPRRAVRAMDILGTMMLRAVEDDQLVPTQGAEWAKP